MAGKISKKSAKVAKKVARKAGAERATAKAVKPRAAPAKAKAAPRKGSKPALLSGGNPQIAKGDGNGPVQAYIAALSGWKQDIARRLDALIVRAVPGVQKAVRWNSPMYGVAGQGFFLGVHAFAKYLKIAFFSGTSLEPMPPGGSTSKATRYLDIYEKDDLDEAQLARWVKQASQLPGEGH